MRVEFKISFLVALLQDISYCDQVLQRDSMDFKSIAAYAKMKKQNIEKLVKLKHHNAICGGKDGKRYHTVSEVESKYMLLLWIRSMKSFMTTIMGNTPTR